MERPLLLRTLRRTSRLSAAHAARVTGVLARAESRLQGGIIVLMYHRILPDSEARTYPLPSLAVGLSAFQQHVAWMAARYQVMPLAQAMRASWAETDAPLACFTFDDGYLDNAQYAAPVLESAGVRGTFFVTGAVESRSLLWYDALLLAWHCDGGARVRQALTQHGVSGEPTTAYEAVQLLKSLAPATRESVIAGLGACDEGDTRYQSMTSDQVRALHARGHEIGSHTLTHPLLPQLSDDALKAELEGSRDWLAALLGGPIAGVCYPNGAIDARVESAARLAGYEYGCTTELGIYRGGRCFRVPRIDVAPQRVAPLGKPSRTAFRAQVAIWSGTRSPMGSTHSRLAYLNTEYPALSHTFIVREVQALREAGVQIVTFSVRRPSCSDALNREYEAEISATHYLLGQPLALMRSQFQAMLSPLAYLTTLLKAQAAAPFGWRALLRWTAYFVQGVHLAQQMRQLGISHVHVHMANNGAAVARLATIFDRRLSYSLSIHGSAEFFDVHNLRLGWKAEGARFVRCISDFCRAQVMIWSNPEVWDHFHIVHCGVDPEEFAPMPARRGDGVLRLLTVGRLVPIKGYPVLLRACREFSRAGIDWRLMMVGDGPMRPRLERLVTELEIQDRVSFRGALAGKQVRDELDRADALIVSSFMEGVPVVLMEAMAKGLAVVSTRVGGVPELIDDGRTGFLVTPGSVASLCDALYRLAKHELPPDASRQARARITANYSVLGMRNGMLQLFRRYGVIAGEASKTAAATAEVADHAIASAG